MIKHKFNGYVRVSKKQAQKMFLSGQEIVLCPSKLRPFEAWHPEGYAHTSKFHPSADLIAEFQHMINNFAYYNCSHEAMMNQILVVIPLLIGN